jgi:hypothetical protein
MIKTLYRLLSPKFQHIFLDYKVTFKPRYGHGKPPHADLYKLINTGRDRYAALIQHALDLKDQIWTIKKAKEEIDSSKPGWNNGFLPGLDIISMYVMFSTYKPKIYIEVGSGNSTKVAAHAKNVLGLSTEIISIDPQPRAEIDQLANRIIREPFENCNMQVHELLEEGDILFIDNSHRILPNSDAMVFFLEVLPKLRKGVIVHIHDIYLPYDYPQFMCDRFYSEQYGLAMYLLANPTKYETLMPNYFISEDAELANQLSTIWAHDNLQDVERHGGSFWLRIKE